MNPILNNIINLHEKYSDKIKSDRHLLLLYWRDVDGVCITKDSIPTSEFLTKATFPTKIMQVNQLYKILKERGEI